MYLPNSDATQQISRQEFWQLHSIHWKIECYHRAIKQVCGIERFMVRTTSAIHTHFFCAIRAFTQTRVNASRRLN